MSILNASAALRMNFMSPPLLSPSPTFSKIHTETWATTRITTRSARTLVIGPSFAMKNETSKHIDKVEEDEEVEEAMEESPETLLHSFTPLPLFYLFIVALKSKSLHCHVIMSWNMAWGYVNCDDMKRDRQNNVA
ncbi:hypothetical protein CMV_014449 [Castanea mollissima]|uniref:Uncharacterized protein n=1 Tax=Castanea mollissima TaxID=60419 RepID=A0A8J4VKX5_9ROSI|nr:hypothetical protein CMV_014449 [Castanea mollissima]